MIATIDCEWLNKNAPRVFDAAAAEAGLENSLERFRIIIGEH